MLLCADVVVDDPMPGQKSALDSFRGRDDTFVYVDFVALAKVELSSLFHSGSEIFFPRH